MRLVIAEKPSVARDLAQVLGARSRREGYFEGDGLRISWCVGHMVELVEPDHYRPEWKSWRMDDLPMVPDHFELRLRGGIEDQWKVLERLLRDRQIRDVVNACDAGREGELIFRYVYQVAGCRLPVQRLWVSSLTDVAIRAGWSNLRPSARYDALADAARCRSEADWLVGMNATRAMTCLARSGGGEQLLSVGRVQTPTLAMIVRRDQEIAAFVPEPFWQVKATFTAAVGDVLARWEARWFREARKDDPREQANEAPHAERLPTEAAARAVVAAAQGQVGVVGTAERRQVREQPPLLYDLSALQQRANQRYGFSADHTLQIAQDLYEKHKLISYPRTDAQYLTPDQVAELPGIVDSLAGLPVYQRFCQQIRSAPIQPGKRVVNPAEVGDHHAILPTGRAPDPARLSVDEKKIFDLVARRLLAALSDDALFDAATIIVEVPPATGAAAELPEGVGAPLRFRARGRICTQEGWRAVDPPGKSRELELPGVQAGQPATAEALKAERGETRPPRPHSDASLLRSMETAGRELDDAELKRAMRSAGLGTPATRAAILQTLLKREYITRQGRDLRATARGIALIEAIPVEQLKSAELTGRWEARLSAIADGEEQRTTFMQDVRASLQEMIDAIRAAAPPPPERREGDGEGAVLGPCPLCGEPVRERRSVYSCDRGRACGFVIYKTMSKRTISATSVKQLLQSGRSRPLKNFKSKKGNTFAAALVLNDQKKVAFEYVNDERPPKDAAGSEGGEAGRGRKRPAPPPDEGGSGDGSGGEGGRRRRPARPEAATTAPSGSGSAPQTPVGMSCPGCGRGQLIAGRSAWGCERWREGCRYMVPFQVDGRSRTPAEAASLVAAAHSGAGRPPR